MDRVPEGSERAGAEGTVGGDGGAEGTVGGGGRQAPNRGDGTLAYIASLQSRCSAAFSASANLSRFSKLKFSVSVTGSRNLYIGRSITTSLHRSQPTDSLRSALVPQMLPLSVSVTGRRSKGNSSRGRGAHSDGMRRYMGLPMMTSAGQQFSLCSRRVRVRVSGRGSESD